MTINDYADFLVRRDLHLSAMSTYALRGDDEGFKKAEKGLDEFYATYPEYYLEMQYKRNR